MVTVVYYRDLLQISITEIRYKRLTQIYAIGGEITRRMITAVVYSESGGTYKTTMTANIAVALERMGQNTLVLDLDPQEGNLTSLFDVGERRGDPDADNLVKHILDMPDGDFHDLIETTAEGVDIIPSRDIAESWELETNPSVLSQPGRVLQPPQPYSRGRQSCREGRRH